MIVPVLLREEAMFAEVSVSSKDAWNSSSKGKTQTARAFILRFNKSSLNTGEPLAWISISESETRGSGLRGGDLKDFSKTANIYLDKEAVVEFVRYAVQNKLLQPENIFSNPQLLEAALRVERKRIRPCPEQATA